MAKLKEETHRRCFATSMRRRKSISDVELTSIHCWAGFSSPFGKPELEYHHHVQIQRHIHNILEAHHQNGCYCQHCENMKGRIRSRPGRVMEKVGEDLADSERNLSCDDDDGDDFDDIACFNFHIVSSPLHSIHAHFLEGKQSEQHKQCKQCEQCKQCKK